MESSMYREKESWTFRALSNSIRYIRMGERAETVKLGVVVGTSLFLLATLAGCATTKAQIASSDPPKSARIADNDPPPDVRHCALVTISSPVLYACNGKVYTEHQLSQRRLAMKQKKEPSNDHKQQAGQPPSFQGNSPKS